MASVSQSSITVAHEAQSDITGKYEFHNFNLLIIFTIYTITHRCIYIYAYLTHVIMIFRLINS